jgi:phosphate uptake regulator
MSSEIRETIVQVNTAINNMITDTITGLQRRDRDLTQKLKESWIGFGIELGELNADVLRILKDNTWRDRKPEGKQNS